MSNHSDRWGGEHCTPTPDEIRALLELVDTIGDQTPAERAVVARVYHALARVEKHRAPSTIHGPLFEVFAELTYHVAGDLITED